MNTSQNPTTHPEIGPRNSVGPAENGVSATTGVIVFNPRPSSLPSGSTTIIKQAIAEGDTTEKRVKQFREAMLPEQK